MNILIAGSVNDYSGSEEERLVDAITASLKEKGHKADNFLLPYKPDALSLMDQITAYSLIDASGSDLLITIGYPACFIRHANKICYLLEAAPMLYEYWDSEFGILGNYQYSQIKIAVNELERKTFSSAKKVFCSSDILKNDIQDRTGIALELLQLPLLGWRNSQSAEAEKGAFIVQSNLLQNSRMFDFIEMADELNGKRIEIYVPDADPIYLKALTTQMERKGLDSEVRVIDGEPSDDTLKNAAAYVHFSFNSRRTENIIGRCMALGVNIIMAQDCGSAAEYCSGYKGAKMCGFGELVSVIRKYKPVSVQPCDIQTVDQFVDKLVII